MVIAAPFQVIFDVETKFVPVTVKRNEALPAGALDLESAVRVGFGLTTVTVTTLESLPPVPFITPTETAPPLSRSVAGTVAVNDPAFP